MKMILTLDEAKSLAHRDTVNIAGYQFNVDSTAIETPGLFDIGSVTRGLAEARKHDWEKGKISAIKTFREHVKCGLAEAKYLVEAAFSFTAESVPN